MSGMEKYAGYALIGVAQAAVEAARAIQAAQEAAARRKAEEQEAQRRFFAYQRGLSEVCANAQERFEQLRSGLDPADEARLSEQIARLSATMLNSSERMAVVNAELQLNALLRDMTDMQRAAQLQEAAKSVEDDRGRYLRQLGALDAQLNALREEGSMEFDAPGRETALAALNNARAAAQGNMPAVWEARLAAAARAVEQHAAAVRTAQESLKRQQIEQQERLDEAASLTAGLLADPAVQRWALAQAQELAARAAGWQAGLAAGDVHAASSAALEELRRDSAALLERVNTAQLKAEQRDYVLRSIREVLEEMGFFPGAVEEETPGHPASALRFRAINAAGQTLGVSVPVEGEIYYDLEGFPMTTEARLGGGSAAVCDSAQAVIEEMHDAIEMQFGVKAGELLWEGKDPLRILRQADQLPASGDSQSRGGSR